MSKYKEFKKNHLDKISPSVCYAKWLWSEFNIPHGTTASCNLNPPHHMITGDSAENLFNTDQKIKERQSMLQGEKPKGCNYCWQAEESNSVSDRILKSYGYVNENLYTKETFKNPYSVPSTIVVIFDTLCNFKCMYCDQSQSSTWESDLRKNGPFKKLYTEHKLKYQGLSKTKYKSADEQKILTTKFFEYVKKNLSKINTISVQGGEPTMSPQFWHFIDFLSKLDAKHLIVAIHTNLNPSQGYNFEKLIQYKNNFADIRINGSLENIEHKAEMSRHGTNWKQLSTNVDMILKNKISLSFTSTLGAMQVQGYLDLCDWRKSLEQKYNTDIGYNLAFVVDPSFQKIEVLPNWYRQEVYNQYVDYCKKNSWVEGTKMKDYLNRIMNTLKLEQLSQAHQNDFKCFVQQYAQRCGFDLKSYGQIADWIID